MHKKYATRAIVAMASVAALACSGSGKGNSNGVEPPPADPGAPGIENDGFGQVPATPLSVLRTPQSCDDLLGMLQRDALRKMND